MSYLTCDWGCNELNLKLVKEASELSSLTLNVFKVNFTHLHKFSSKLTTAIDENARSVPSI